MMLPPLFGMFELATAWLPKGRLRICDFGNQCMDSVDYQGLYPQESTLISSSKLFRRMGHEYISIDINGKCGALPIDLGMPLSTSDKVRLGTFHIVMNFGTIEHIENDMQAFSNAHTLCMPNGIILHAVPKLGTYQEHGIRQYTMAFK